MAMAPAPAPGWLAFFVGASALMARLAPKTVPGRWAGWSGDRQEKDQTMLATAAPTVYFDGRDLTDEVPSDDVHGYALNCPVCGTVRDVRYPFCCEFAAEPIAERELALV